MKEKFTIQIEKENYLFIVINTYIVTVLINTISSCQITYGIKKKDAADPPLLPFSVELGLSIDS